jgi:tetrahydrodipicolinate N-succinyltransferase
MSFSTAYVQELSEETQEEAKAAFYAIFAFLNTTGTKGKVTRKRITLLNQVTLDHRPNQAQVAQMAKKRLLKAAWASKEQERQNLLEAARKADMVKKAQRAQKTKDELMFASFAKAMKVTETV